MSPLQAVNPEGLVEPAGFLQAGVAHGSRSVYVSGQVAEDQTGAVVGEADLAAQTERALLNVATALDAAGAAWTDVAKANVFVVDWEESKMESIRAGFVAAAETIGFEPRPMTLIGVTGLARAELLVEIDVVAVLD